MTSLLAERVGTQTPRVDSHPPYSFTDADEVIDLYDAVMGRPLDLWQQLVLRHGLGRVTPQQWAAFKVGCWVPRQNGKGDIILALELAWLFLPGFQVPLVTHSAHLYSTCQEAFLRMRNALDGSDMLRPKIKAIREANGEQGVILRTGQRLKFMARTRSGGRGFSAPRVVLDEAQELQPLMMASALPTMSAQPDPQVWFFGTPPDDPTAWAYNLKSDGESGAPDLAWFDFGADLNLDDSDDQARVADRELWYATNPALGIRITERFVESELRPSGLGELFPYERLGVWRPRSVDAASRVLPGELWGSLAETDVERPEGAAFAVHVNQARTRTAIAYAGRRGDGPLQVGLVDWRAGTGWVVDRLVALRQRWGPVAIAVDTRSERLLLDLEKAGVTRSEDLERPEAGDVVVPTASDTAAAFGLFVDLARAQPPGLRHGDDAPVNTALAQAGTRPLAGGATWDLKGPGEVGPLKAVTLAAWAFESRAHLLRAELDEVGVW